MSESNKSFSFPRSRRLLNGKAFSYVFDQPMRFRTPAFLALYRKSETEDTRIGFAISKKKLPLAKDRNHFRRIARESFRYHLFNQFAVDIVIIAYADAQNLDNTTLFNAFEKTWLKIDQYCKK